MGNNKKSSRSSRGRSNYVKMVQRSQPNQKRIRKKDEPEVTTAKKRNEQTPMLTGLIFGATVGVFVGMVFDNVILGSLIGAVIGGFVGCIVDLLKTKVFSKKK